MAASWVDLSTVHDPTPDTAPPPEWGDGVNGNFQYLYERTERVIARTVLGTAAASIASGTLPTVTNGWKLRAVLYARHATGTVLAGLRFNSDSGNNYYAQQVYGQNTTVAATISTASSSLLVGAVDNDGAAGWAVSETEIYEYLNGAKKTALTRAYNVADAGTNQVVRSFGGVWNSTAAITSLSLHAASGNFIAGTTLTVLATPIPV